MAKQLIKFINWVALHESQINRLPFMLSFFVCPLVVGDKMMQTERIYSFFVNSSSISRAKFECNCVVSAFTQEEQYTLHSWNSETWNLLVSHRMSSNFEHDNRLSREEKIIFHFFVNSSTENIFFCVLFAALFQFLSVVYIFTYYSNCPIREFIVSLFSVFISLKMERTHLVVLVVSALAWMPQIAAERFIETKYHCPKK